MESQPQPQPEPQPQTQPQPNPPPIFLTPPSPKREPEKKRSGKAILIAILLIGLLAGGVVGYVLVYAQFNGRLDTLQAQMGIYQKGGGGTQSFLLNDNVSLSALYQQVKGSVVIVQDLVAGYTFFGQKVYTLQQGSGFVTEVNNQNVVVTNNHVVDGTINVTVTFADSTCVPATVLGQDSKADLAVLSVPSMPSDTTPLIMVSSTAMTVGDPDVAVGSPHRLSGTLTTGVISALGEQ